MTTAYPLAWPDGWPRFKGMRKSAQFGVQTSVNSNFAGSGVYTRKRALSIADGIRRVREVLDKMGVDVANDCVVSTNLKLNMSGLPRGDQGEPADPGAAVYWQVRKGPSVTTRVMAIDQYGRVADNLGAIAATLEAMRAIERYGGAQILDRAFTGFTALPPPKNHWQILGLQPGSGPGTVKARWRELVASSHPDRGGSESRTAELNAARDAALKEVGA